MPGPIQLAPETQHRGEDGRNRPPNVAPATLRPQAPDSLDRIPPAAVHPREGLLRNSGHDLKPGIQGRKKPS
eukprot:3767731-Pyramimonas_sp.AAC.1